MAGIESAARVGHLACDVIERVLGHAAVGLVARDLPCLQVNPIELRIIIKHFLKVCESMTICISRCNPSHLISALVSLGVPPFGANDPLRQQSTQSAYALAHW
jgi:hypothetical protein